MKNREGKIICPRCWNEDVETELSNECVEITCPQCETSYLYVSTNKEELK